MTSRVSKLLREATGSSRLADADALRASDVVLTVGPNAAPLLVRSAAALILRCFTGRLLIRPTEGAGLSSEALAAVESEAAGYGCSERVQPWSGGDGIALAVGCRGKGVFVDASGWTAHINQLSPGGAPPEAPAAAFAAAAGVAKLFAQLMGRSERVVSESWSLCLLKVEGGAGERVQPDLGRVLLIGAGAIGAGFAFTIRYSGWNCNLHLADRERYDEPNHETTLVISMQAALRRSPKAATLAALVKTEKLQVTPYQTEVVEGHELLRTPFDAIVCAVDNRETRRALDHTVAALVLNGAVGGSVEDAGHVLVSRHGPDDPLLSSLYQENSADVMQDLDVPEEASADSCSRVAYARATLAAPFLALASGALLAAALAENALRKSGEASYVKFDLFGLQRWATRRRVA